MKDWVNVKFGNIAESITNIISKPKESGLKDYIGLDELDTDQIRIKRFASTEDVNAQKFLCKKGDIIFGKRNAYLRKVAVTDRDAVASAHSMILRSKGELIYNDFLPCLMQSSNFWKVAQSISEGSMSPTIKWHILAEQEFLIPSLEQQKKIAELLWTIENTMQKTEHIIFLTEKLKISFMKESYSQKNILYESFGKLFNFTKGKAPKQTYENIEKGYIPYLNTDYLRIGGITTFIPETEKTLVKIDNKDIIILWDGSKAGEIFSGKEGFLSSTMAKVNYDKTKFSPRFIYYFLKLNEQEIKSNCKGTGIPHVEGKLVESMKFPLIDIKTQEKIVNKINTICEFYDNQWDYLKKLNNLKRKLTNKLISGEIILK